jgi:hypothetical protein
MGSTPTKGEDAYIFKLTEINEISEGYSATVHKV